MNAPLSLREAIAALRTGRTVSIGSTQAMTVAALETATPELLTIVDGESQADLLISGERAAALSLGNFRNAADPRQPVLIARAPWLDAGAALDLADPANDMARGPTGPLSPVPVPDEAAAKAALTLARLSGLLPALWVLPTSAPGSAIAAETILSAASAAEVAIVARARLPIEDVPDAQIVAFRGADDGQEHVALVIGAFGGKPPLVRLHSECLTGDVFGSLKCDCGPQLKEALRIIAAAGGGILLYLRQEGRGVGLANKLRAYALQDRGLDTVEANQRLGFADDERDYGHAAAMLGALGVRAVRLLTNNPSKVAGQEAAGIEVVERVAHHMPANPHNADYLATKRKKSGHLG